MQKVIDQITDHLVGLIKNDQPSYTPQELLKAGIPLYIVERIRLTLEDRIAEDLKKPESKWFSFNNDLVQHTWDDFVISATSSSIVPHDEVYNVLHHVIGEIISVFLEPRKKMASYLFREDKVLDFEEASKRCARLTIYKHFGKAVPLYMQKKGLQEISIERCEQLIKNLDERLVSGYSAEDWAQKLELLFTLFGGKIEPYLLKIFFEDKGLYNAAEAFAHIDVALTKSTFIEILSSKDLVDLTGSAPKKTTPEAKEATQTPSADKKSKAKTSSKGSKKEVEKAENRPMNLADIYATEAGISDDEMNDILSDIALGGVIEVDNLEQAESLNALFDTSEEEDDQQLEDISESGTQNEEMREFRDNLTLILDQAKHSFENVVGDHSEDDEGIDVSVTDDDIFGDDEELFEPDPDEATSFADDSIETEGESNTELDGENEKPMWAQFLNEDQMAVLMGKRSESESEAEGDKDKNEEEKSTTQNENVEPKETKKATTTKQTKPSTQPKNKVVKVEETLDEEEGLLVEDEDDDLLIEPSESILDRFAESRTSYVSLSEFLEPRSKEWKKDIFKGSKSKFEKALDKLEEMNTWDEASAFLQNNVFEKNSVDMFSEIAIDFTDRLHTYFKEYKS